MVEYRGNTGGSIHFKKALATVTWKCNNNKNIIVTLETKCRNAWLGKDLFNYECNNNYWGYGYIALLLHEKKQCTMGLVICTK